jgi:hypothetical protein
MKGIGWEIRPLGWVLLIVLAVVLAVVIGYFVYKRLHPPPAEQKVNT